MMTQACERCCPQPLSKQCRDTSVLVIDDDEDFRLLARKILEAGGYQVTVAASVAAGLAHLRSNPTSLLVLDIVMPGRDGMDALGEIRSLFPEVKIVTVSGAGDSELYLTVSAFPGADASLDKSRIASLCTLLRVVLDR